MTHLRSASALLLVLCLLLPNALAYAQAPAADRDWAFVSKLLDDGMGEVAARQMERFAADHPEDPRAPVALLRAARMHEVAKAPGAALRAYAALLDAFPDMPQAATALLRKGELLADGGRPEPAAEAFRSLLLAHPTSEHAPAARLGLAEALMARGDVAGANRALRQLLAASPSPAISARARYDLAILEQQAGADAAAIEAFAAIHRDYPGELVAGFGLLRAADLELEREAPAAARNFLQLAAREYEAPFLRARAHLSLAALDEADGNFKDAATHYREVADKGGDPTQLSTALLGLGRCELETGRSKQAEAAADSWLQTHGMAPGHEAARLIRARAQLARGADAARDSLRALTRASDSRVAHESWKALANASEGRDALRAWSAAAAVAADPSQEAQARLKLAGLHEVAGNWGAALHEAELAAAAVEGGDWRAEALAVAARAAESAGDLPKALKLARQLRAEAPFHPRAEAAEGRILRLQLLQGRNPERAREELALVAERDDIGAASRRLLVARVLARTAVDPAAALRHLDGMPEGLNEDARARVELTRESILQLQARLLASEGNIKGAQEAWAGAQRSLRLALPLGDEALRRSLEVRLASLARPSTPWDFEATTEPLPSQMDRSGSAALQLAAAFESAWSQWTDADARAWARWRSLELSGAPLEARLILHEEGQAVARDADLGRAYDYMGGSFALEARDAAAAAARFRKVLRSDQPDALHRAANAGLAEALRAEERYVPAAELYLQLAEEAPRTREGQRALLLAGDCALNAGEAERAVEHYRSLLQRFPDSAFADDAQFRLGRAQQRRGRSEAAIEAYGVLVDGEPSRWRSEARWQLATLLRQAGDEAAAAAQLAALYGEDRQASAEKSLALEMARIQLAQGEHKTALDWLKRVEGEATAAKLALEAAIRAASGDRRRARALLDELAQGFPAAAADAAAARCALADAEAEAGEYANAAELYRLASAEAPLDAAELRARATYGEGFALARGGESDAAASRLQAVVRAHPRSPFAAESLYMLGSLAANQGDDRGSQIYFAQLATDYAEHPLAPNALRMEANAWRNLERFDEARSRYDALLSRYPEAVDGPEVLSDIAWCEHEMGRFELAMASYQRALPLLEGEDQAFAQYWIADCLQRLSRLDESVAAYLRIPYEYPEQGQLAVTAQLKAGEVYEQMGDPAQAAALYEKVLRSHGAGSDWGAEAQRRLQALGALGSNNGSGG